MRGVMYVLAYFFFFIYKYTTSVTSRQVVTVALEISSCIITLVHIWWSCNNHNHPHIQIFLILQLKNEL